MRPSFRIALTLLVALFAFTSDSQAQFRGGFGRRHTTFFQVRTGPLSSFTYISSGYGFVVPIYNSGWYYGPGGIPIYNNPYYNPQPPVVIQNIVQQPVAAPAPPAVSRSFPRSLARRPRSRRRRRQ